MSHGSSLVSVVTPVFNAEAYIRECVESVLRQTYPHFEYIVVDNCSTDRTADIVSDLADRDSRIRLVQPGEFVGPDPNANRALREISADSSYVKIVHADDWLFPECLERMVSLASAHPGVGVVGAYRLEGNLVTLDGLPVSLSVVPGAEVGRAHLLGRPWGYVLGSPSSVLYRADLVRARPDFYPLDNPFQSDQEACLLLLQESDFGFVHQVLTYTRRHEGADSSFYTRVGAGRPGQLNLLLKYGRRYLSEDEYRLRLAARTVDYGFLLVRNAHRFRDPAFRAYQLEMINSLRGRLAPEELIDGLAQAIGKAVRS